MKRQFLAGQRKETMKKIKRSSTNFRAKTRRRLASLLSTLTFERLEQREMLAADFDLSQYPAVEGFLLTAEKQGSDYQLSLRDRSNPGVMLDQLMFLTTPQSVSIEGSAGDDSLWIDFSTVITVDAGGNFSDFIPASINFTGLGGIDEVEFTGPTAVTGNIIVDAETIVGGKGVRSH